MNSKNEFKKVGAKEVTGNKLKQYVQSANPNYTL